MRPTPDYSAWYDYTDSVYEPSEDSFVFLDGIEKEIEEKLLGKDWIKTGKFDETRKYVMPMKKKHVIFKFTDYNSK